MAKSMTGFGRSSGHAGGRSLTLELKSVNSRFLDFNIRMPRTLFSLEERIKKRIGQDIGRGKVDVYLTYRNSNEADQGIRVNRGAAARYVSELRDLAKELTLPEGLSAGILVGLEGVVALEPPQEDEEELWALMRPLFDEALAQHTAMRSSEGAHLKEQLLDEREAILAQLLILDELAPEVKKSYYEKVRQKVLQLTQSTLSEDRLVQEVALMAERASIEEEITRLRSHMDQLEGFLQQSGSIGRALDFLAQEMNREANTIASKASDPRITQAALALKGHIEDIREQVQNLE
ncbi:Protein YicC [Clostridiaceae bacterium JG1575]|nr:Protein YicC [Clostridiaceae bacterium JG1575]